MTIIIHRFIRKYHYNHLDFHAPLCGIPLWHGITRLAEGIDMQAKRARLAPRGRPYWQPVAGSRGGVSLGYRKPKRGAGVWAVKLVFEGDRVEGRLGFADDEAAPFGSVTFRVAVTAALDWAKQQYAIIEARGKTLATREQSVRSAIEAYSAARTKNKNPRGGTPVDGSPGMSSRIKPLPIPSWQSAERRPSRLGEIDFR